MRTMIQNQLDRGTHERLTCTRARPRIFPLSWRRSPPSFAPRLSRTKIQTEALPSSLSFSFVSHQQLACSVAMGQGLSHRSRLGRVDHVVCPTDLLFSL